MTKRIKEIILSLLVVSATAGAMCVVSGSGSSVCGKCGNVCSEKGLSGRGRRVRLVMLNGMWLVKKFLDWFVIFSVFVGAATTAQRISQYFEFEFSYNRLPRAGDFAKKEDKGKIVG